MNKRRTSFTSMLTLFYISINLLKLYGQIGLSFVQYRITSLHMCLSRDSLLYTTNGVSVKQCLEDCADLLECSAVNYKRRYQICELHSNLHEIVGRNVGPCLYVKRSDMLIVETTTNICQTCKDNGTCNSYLCSSKYCPTLEIVDGVIRGNRKAVGSHVEIVCRKYFKELFGVISTICRSNGSWTHTPECVPSFSYIGCYEDRQERIVYEQATKPNLLTTEVCVRHCFMSDFIYALTEVGEECHCGNTLRDSPKKADDECNQPCQGNSSQMCGSNWRGSVYKHI